MATYKEIKGVTIQTLDSDPVEDKGTFSTGGNLNSGRSLAAAGDKTAGLGFGGYDGPPNTKIDLTEQYNGTSWSEVNELNVGRYAMVGLGTQTAAIGAGGYTSPPTPTPHRNEDVESWNGTNWTEVAELNSDMRSGTGFGTATAGYVIGGVRGGSVSDAVESWNGSSWTETTEINTARAGAAGAGITTAGLIFGGTTAAPAITGITESWNGSAWSETSDMPTAADSVFGGGTSTLAAAAGGSVPSKITTLQLWDGSNWTTNPTGLAGQRSSGGTNSSPTQGNLLVTGGTGPGPTNYNPTATEELSFPPPTSAILREGMLFLSGGTTLKGFGKAGGIPNGSWASGGSMNTARANHTGAGISQDSALAYGGSGPGDLTESYDGTSWSELNEINTARTEANRGLGGIQTSALLVSGSNPSGIPTNVESWNGSSWTEIAEVNASRYNNSSAIPNNTTGMIFGGENSGFKVTTEIWDGTSWTEVGDLLTPVNNSGGAGTVTAAICVGGQGPPNAAINETVTWNGSSWTEVTSINRNVRGMASAGIQTSALISGGDQPPYVVSTEFWNGSSWTELNNLSTAVGSNSGGGTAASAISAGGNPGPVTAQTEEWTAVNTLSTITVS
jgi:hypothetical protein